MGSGYWCNLYVGGDVPNVLWMKGKQNRAIPVGPRISKTSSLCYLAEPLIACFEVHRDHCTRHVDADFGRSFIAVLTPTT